VARKFKTPITIDELGSASSQALAANVDGDSQNRINIDAGGKITWGSGSATGDTTLYRSAADTLKTDDAFTATSLAVTGQFTFPTSDGSADQVITTNGSGTLTWSDVSANATVSDTAPSSPATGQIWYESDTGKTFVYYDSFWIEVGASPPASPFITDLDEDTKIQVEESSDEDKIRFDTAGSERMIIDNTGNVGIGTTTPGQALAVEGRIVANHTGNAFPLSVQSDQSTSGIILSDAGTTSNVVLRSSGDDFQIRTNANSRVTVKSDGKVGIGTTTPGYKLEVDGTLAITNESTSLISNNSSSGREVLQMRARTGTGDGAGINLYGDADASHAGKAFIYSGGSATLAVDGGNVGIGTTSPETPLNIVTTNKLGSTFTGTTDGEGLRVDQSDYTAGNYVSLVEASYDDGQTAPHVRIGAMYDGGGSNLAFGTSNNYSTGITNTAMFIDSSGNVGINDTTPSYKLDVKGSAQVASGDDTDLFVKTTEDSSYTAAVTIGGARTSSSLDNLSQLRFHNYSNQSTSGDYEAARISAVDPSGAHGSGNGALVFKTSNGGSLSERMRIDENGKLLLSGGSSTTSIPSAVNNAGDEDGLFLYAKTGNGTARLGMWIDGDGGNGDLPFVVANSNSTITFNVYGDGDVVNTNNSYGQISDASIKQDIVDASSQWDDIKAVQLRNYRLIQDVENDGDNARVYLGVVAQELEAAGMSGLVTTRQNDLKSVKSSVLYMKAVGALQEAQNRIEALETTNSDLIARIEALEAN